MILWLFQVLFIPSAKLLLSRRLFTLPTYKASSHFFSQSPLYAVFLFSIPPLLRWSPLQMTFLFKVVYHILSLLPFRSPPTSSLSLPTSPVVLLSFSHQIPQKTENMQYLSFVCISLLHDNLQF